LSIADSIENALPALGRQGALDTLTAANALAATLWQVTHPQKRWPRPTPKGRAIPPDWNLEFLPALTRLLTATCAGLMASATATDSNPGSGKS
jgi:hypothetical protein